MNFECQRWAKLADRDALGEPLPSDDRAFQLAHEQRCADCAREARVFRSLMPASAAPDAPVDEREVANLLSLAVQDQSQRAAAARRWKGTIVVLGGITACAAAALLWLGGKPGQPAPTDRVEHALRAPAIVPSSVSEAAVPALAVSSLPVEAPGARCSQVVPGATVCLERGAVLARRSLSGPHRELEVARGRAVVSLEPQAPGTSFSLTTARGKVTAVGTIFSVDVGEDGSTVARVVEGKVLVRIGDTAHAVRAGEALRFGEPEVTPLSDQDRDLDLTLLSMAEVKERAVAPHASAGPAAARGEQTPARDSLEYARSLRASGDFRGAADVYRKIHADNPRSPSGRAALVSLGDVLLTLHDPAGALSAFDSYLAGGGTLTQEALAGRVRALRALNRPSDEQRAIERFLAAYPDAPQSRILRARLAALQK